MITPEVASGVTLISHAHVNCYLIEDDDGVTLVDAGLPSMWSMVLRALEEHGRRPEDVKALVLTHAHFDHVGFARRAHRSLGVPVFVHADDEWLAAHPYRYEPQENRLLYPVTRPASWPLLGRMALAGALVVRGIREVETMPAGAPLDVPGRPVPLHTPGHTDGHVALHLPERDVVFSGDALVTLDPYTGQVGPQIVAVAATKDADQALASLDVLAETGASTVLPGHGTPWLEGVERAVGLARRVGEH